MFDAVAVIDAWQTTHLKHDSRVGSWADRVFSS